jgi:hypothetical protein
MDLCEGFTTNRLPRYVLLHNMEVLQSKLNKSDNLVVEARLALGVLQSKLNKSANLVGGARLAQQIMALEITGLKKYNKRYEDLVEARDQHAADKQEVVDTLETDNAYLMREVLALGAENRGLKEMQQFDQLVYVLRGDGADTKANGEEAEQAGLVAALLSDGEGSQLAAARESKRAAREREFEEERAEREREIKEERAERERKFKEKRAERERKFKEEGAELVAQIEGLCNRIDELKNQAKNAEEDRDKREWCVAGSHRRNLKRA